MKVGLFFGSFNPVHIGHLAIANYMVEYSDLDQVWFVVSPQNPFKEKASLLKAHHRLQMVNIAIEDDLRFKASNIEFSLPQPSYTADTLAYLKDKYPSKNFALIMGEDNLRGLHKWKNSDFIVDNYDIYVYPRDGKTLQKNTYPKVQIVNAPLMEISSSFIRQAIKENKDVRYFLHSKVFEYMDEMNFYK